MSTVGKWFSKTADSGWDNLIWVIETMSVTQWGIVSVVFVLAGFMALRTRF